MQLRALPITAQDAPHFLYDGGDVDTFEMDVLDRMETLLMRRTDGSNLAPELLNPFVFMQFVMGMQGKYTVNGAPFCGNWRLLPAARRMAGRLGADALEAELAQAQSDLAAFDTAVLDSYDNADGWQLFDAQPKDVRDKIVWTVDGRFTPLIEAVACTYGNARETFEKGDKLLAALCDWLHNEFPKEIVPDRHAVGQRLRDNINWASDTVENFEQEYAKFYVGVEVYQILKDNALRFANTETAKLEPVPDGVITTRFAATNGRIYLVLWFSDTRMVVDKATLTELGQAPYPEGMQPRSGVALSQASQLAYDPKTFETRRASHFNPSAKFIKPKVT